VKTHSLGDTDLRVSELGFRLRTASTHPAELVRAAVEEGITYFQVESVRRVSLLRRALGALWDHMLVGVVSAPDEIQETSAVMRAQLVSSRLGVLWVKPGSSDEAQLERALSRVHSLQGDGQVGTFGFAVSHLSADEQIAVGRWALETASTPLMQIGYSLHEPRVGRELFALAAEGQTMFVVALPKVMTRLDSLLGEDLSHVVSTVARKTRQLRFLTESGRSLAQSALKFALAQPSVACVLPAIYSQADLHSSVAAGDAPDLTRAELNRLDDLVTHGFHIAPGEAPSVYNG
jgi:aryl-alcohol dehydrogenase-like predicted oxidoreductase